MHEKIVRQLYDERNISTSVDSLYEQNKRFTSKRIKKKIVVCDEAWIFLKYKESDGSTFEKIIAGMIGGIAQTVFNFSTNDSIDGNSNIEYDNLYRDLFGIQRIEKGVFFYSSKEYLTDKERQQIEEIVAKMQEFGISFKTKEQITANDEQKKKEINFEDMTPEQLQKMIDENQKIIENNERQIKEDTQKSKLIQRILEQQKTIDAQQEEINGIRKILESPQQ